MIRNLVLVFFLFPVLFASAQEQHPAVVFKQKFLRPRAVDNASSEKIDSTHSLRLMIGGNIYQTERHVASSYNAANSKYDFRDEFRYIQPIINLGDVAIANLKASFGNNVGDMFSVPDEFALALKYSGINTIMHANVHTANIDKATLTRTRNLLNEFDMYHTGSFANAAERLGNYPLIVNKKGFRIAILNYTRLAGRPSISKDFIINDADKFYIERDMRQAKANKPDFIIAYFDWGTNDQDIPSSWQQDIVQYTFEQGANLVVGTLPNTPMRLDYVNYYTNGTPKEGIVAYSLGNLVGSNEQVNHRNGYVIEMELSKNDYTGETKIGDWGVIPVYTYYDTAANGAVKIYSLPSSSMENGEIFANASYIEKRHAVNSAYQIRQLLGSTGEEIQYRLSEQIVSNVMETMDITQSSLNNKLSVKRKDDIAPTAAPVLATTDSTTNSAPSLAMLYKTEAPPPPPVKEEKKKETTFDKQKKLAENIFNPDTKLEAKKVEPIAAPPVEAQLNAMPLTEKKTTLVQDTIYRIQFYALKNLIPIDTNYYTHLKGYEVYEDNGYYKYVVGDFRDYKVCYNYWKSQMLPRYKTSYIVKYLKGKRLIE